MGVKGEMGAGEDAYCTSGYAVCTTLKMFGNCWKMEGFFCDLKEMVRFGTFELRECER
ncbi:hypothetical protein HanXRQr2_Chr15g0713831 [Helianthus annuus]|uniref:Uncharacterized protein n=1 Tax=Helianthus annuus TaxID=4232 RepID=A0A9K3E4M8_HELAN|nr:hypothetical protein HanXRQr2_Chr15g0713831 [Helianthus annuus]KAJ0832986.1 hypothetical protein HanPSC8_Chr15g0685031 [Helianthus annuus]